MSGNGNSGRKKQDYPDELVARIRDLYGAGMSHREVAKEIGLAHSTVGRIMRQAQLEVRRKGRDGGQHGQPQTYHNGCRCDYCFAAHYYVSRDDRVAVECWCRNRMMLVTAQVIRECRTVCCGSSACRRIEQAHFEKRAA